MECPAAGANIIHVVDAGPYFDGFVFGFDHLPTETAFVVPFLIFSFFSKVGQLVAVDLLYLGFVNSVDFFESIETRLVLDWTCNVFFGSGSFR